MPVEVRETVSGRETAPFLRLGKTESKLRHTIFNARWTATMLFADFFRFYYSLRASWNVEHYQWDKAIRNLSKFISWNRTEPEAYASRGFAYLNEYRLDDAIHDYTTAIDLEPRATYFLGRASARLRQEDYVGAMADVDEALWIDPKFILARATRAALCLEMGDGSGAMAQVSTLIEEHPGRAEGYAVRAVVFVSNSDFANALDDLSSSISLMPNDPLNHNNLSWFLAACPAEKFRSGTRAVRYAKRACGHTSWRCWYCLGTLGAAHAEVGNFTAARSWQKKALDLIPSGHRKGIAMAEQRMGLYEAGQAYRFDPRQFWEA